ncbi:MAG: HEAT repeat domain-containing protein [Clostridiaceae bacterium]|nr:HEAT repeat domain-containing protein [Clostridiaceae bacterium]
MNIKDLEEKINKNEIDEAIYIIEQIAERKIEKSVPFLIEQLESTNNHLLRNAIAIALSDIGDEEAVDPIIRLLKHPKTKGFRGTLLAALEPFDYSRYLDTLVDFMCEGNFEVSRKALLLIEAMGKDMLVETRQKCVAKVRAEIERLQDKIDFLSESLDVLEEE